MTTLLSTVVLLAALVALTGLGPSLAVAPTRTTALALAPAMTGIACSLAVAASVLTGTPLVPWLILAAVLGWATAWHRRVTRPAVADPGTERWTLVTAWLVALVPLALIAYPATGGDARANFWLHASWFLAGGDAARTAMENPAYAYTHPAYPPLVPGLIASVWRMSGGHDREVALRVGQLVTAYGVATLAFFTVHTLDLRRRHALLAAGGLAWLAWSAKVEVGVQGLLDLTWALLLAAAAVLVLVGGPERRRAIAMGSVLAAAGAFTKTEAQVAALALTLAAFARFPRQWRALLPLPAAVVGAIGAWALVIRPSQDDRGDWSKLPDLLHAGSEVSERFGDSVSRFLGDMGPLVAAGVAVVVLALVIARWAGVPLRQRGTLTLLALGLMFSCFTVVTFAVRPEEIDFLLSVTAYRTAIFVRLLVAVDVALVVIAGARALGLAVSDDRTPDDPAPDDTRPATAEMVR